MRYFNKIDVDLRQVSQLKACFISKDQGLLPHISLDTFKETLAATFKHFRQPEEISAKICECTISEVSVDGTKTKMADSSKLNTLVEFMKCYPVLVKRDKNSSSGMNFIMAESDTKPQVSINNELLNFILTFLLFNQFRWVLPQLRLQMQVRKPKLKSNMFAT